MCVLSIEARTLAGHAAIARAAPFIPMLPISPMTLTLVPLPALRRPTHRCAAMPRSACRSGGRA
ncbi:protein of unknown function [Burkholderia multivorans]